MFWNEKIETMSHEDMRALQLERLKETVTRTYHSVPFYKKRFDEIGLKPEDIRTLEDIQKIPFTVKDDLRDNYPFGLFGVPMRDIVRIHASSGTTGKPTTVGYTRKDLDNWSECIGPADYHGRRNKGRYYTDRFWLWLVYRRFWPTPGHGENRRGQ